MFPNSKITKFFMCANENYPDLNGDMLPELKSYVVSRMKAEPYCLVNDGTSDTSFKKMTAACALIYDETGRIQIVLICVPPLVKMHQA